MQLLVKDYDIRVIDSLNWFQMPLAKLPKTFGLDETKLSKGTFPHLFNIKEHFGYIGPMPDIKYYCPDSLTKDARAKLLSWHADMCAKNYVFNFDVEIERYCIQDVNILRESCLRFREIFLTEMDVDPFRYVTIAATVMGVFKAKFLQPDTIGIVPTDLYRGVQKLYSKSSIQWLDFVSMVENKKIVHAENQGEHKIVDTELGKTYYVDGFCQETNEVFEFLGCLFHAHDKCFDQNSCNPKNRNVTNSKIFQDTMARIKRLEELGYTVKYIWECDFDRLCQTSTFKNFLVDHEFVGNLNPRDAFYGGRTNAVKLYHSCKPGEKIKYVDFTSLYPFVNKTKTYPICHPVIITENFGDIKQYFGVIKCKVLPPSNLFLPVLPVKLGGKLVFPLCKQCALTNNNDPCSHSVQDRSFWGTWCTIEVQKAVEMGYKILEVKEVWHFERTSNSLFKDYVHTFLRSKQESSDFPEWVQSEDDKSQYIHDYFQHEGVQLRKEKIEKNPGLRAISKLCLNSLWGKFGMNTEREESELVFEPKRFYEVIHDDELDLLDLFVINNEVVELVYKRKKEVAKESNVTNIFIAIFTTAWARLELYNLISSLGERVLYMDTDSCVFLSKEGEPEPPLSDFLGGLTDELSSGDGSERYIQEFVSCGPKNYAYKVSDGSCTVKVKGFRLNYQASQLINLDSMKSLVHDIKAKQTITVVNENKITREPLTRKIINKREEKKYQLVYDKRIIIDDGPYTIPYGYYWNPCATAISTKKHSSVNINPHELFSNPSVNNSSPELGELFPYEDAENISNDESIDLMATSESESEDEYTAHDLEFLDEAQEDNDLSFYRSIDNTNFSY